MTTPRAGETADGTSRTRRRSHRNRTVERGNGNGSGAIQVTSSDVITGDYHSRLEAVVVGDPVEIIFAGDQLSKGLSALDREEVVIEIIDRSQPAVFRACRSKQVIQPLSS